MQLAVVWSGWFLSWALESSTPKILAVKNSEYLLC